MARLSFVLAAVKRAIVFDKNTFARLHVPRTLELREHVVPLWLLEMTGDPRRVVTFGLNFDKRKEAIRYSWSSFVAPACGDCNNEYAELEGRVKHSIESLQRREALRTKRSQSIYA